jgi:hypothetical protein
VTSFSLPLTHPRCLGRFKNAVAQYPSLATFVFSVEEWSERWLQAIEQPSTTFEDPFKSANEAGREILISHLRKKISRIVTIAHREQDKVTNSTRKPQEAPRRNQFLSRDAILAALLNSYEGPGEERPDGPRHDNDFIDIDRIRIAPTNQELTCRIEPFLPANFYGAPHPLENGTMERLLDIQFRLLREELMYVHCLLNIPFSQSFALVLHFEHQCSMLCKTLRR